MQPVNAPTRAKPITLRAIAQHVCGVVDGDEQTPITGVSSIEDAEEGDLVFAENARFLAQANRSRASAIMAAATSARSAKPLVRVENPRLAFSQVLGLFSAAAPAPVGVHALALVADDARIGADASIGPFAVIGAGATIGDRATIGAGCFVGEGCAVGEETLLHPNVTLLGACRLGSRVIVHSGAVVGADGFGYVRVGDRSEKVPHVGTVVVGDDVEIGANTTIDRAKTGVTSIGERTKIDNLVHIAHNVQIGADCIVVAQVGVAGSAVIGRGAVLAGQAGIRDHVTIGDGAMVLAQAGIIGDVPARAVYSGYPALPHRERMRVEAASVHLPEYARRIRELEARNAALAARIEALERSIAGAEREE